MATKGKRAGRPGRRRDLEEVLGDLIAQQELTERRARKRAEEEARRARERAEEEARRARERAEEEARRVKARAEEEARRAKEEERRAKERAEEEARQAMERAEAVRLREEAERRTRAELDEAIRVVAEVSKKVGELTAQYGRNTEDLLAPSIVAQVRRMGIRDDVVLTRLEAKRHGQVIKETDAIIHGIRLETDQVVCVVVSVKSRARPEDVDRLLADLDRFHDHYPVFRNAELVGVLAAVGIDENVVKRAERVGLYVIRTGPKVARIVNGRDFRPRIWQPAS